MLLLLRLLLLLAVWMLGDTLGVSPRLPEAFTSAMSRHLRPGRLLRFSLATGGLVLSPEGRPAGADLSYIGPANQRRGRADVMHKILFQAAARCGGLSWEQLLAAAQSSEAAAAAAAAEAAAGGATQEPAAAGGLQLTGMTLG
jgi:snurportin-1